MTTTGFLCNLYIWGKSKLWICVAFFCVLFIPSIHGQFIIPASFENEFTYDLTLKVFEEQEGSLTINQVQNLKSSEFKNANEVDFKPNKVYWASLFITNQNIELTDYILELGGYNSYVSVFYNNGLGLAELKTGNYEKMSERDLPYSKIQAVGVHLPYRSKIKIYIRYSTIDYTTPKIRYLKLVNRDVFYQQLTNRNLIQGWFQGGIWFMILYNLFIFLYGRDKTYLNYSLFLLSIGMYAFYYHGFARKFMFPEMTWGEDYVWIISSGTASIFYYYFMRYFLNIRKLAPKINRIIQGWIYVRIIILVVCVLMITTSQSPLLNPVTIFLAAAESLFGIYIFVQLLKTKDKIALFFVVGGFIFTICIFAGMVSYVFYPQLYMLFYEVGSLIEIMAFSLGLGYRIKRINKTKRETQSKLLSIQSKMTNKLEQMVETRTRQLSRSNKDLQEAVEQMDMINDVLEKRNVEVNKQHSKIQASIQYAKRIQDVMLPDPKRMDMAFPDWFALFMPKDVVSGDFYWLSMPSQKTGKVVVAVVDCTGHGVPGAFMSLVSDGLLNLIVNIRQIYEPDRILKELDHAVHATLKQGKSNNRDGMDLAICSYDPVTKTLTYAGARNPLVIIQGNKLQVVKGDRLTIGGHQKSKSLKNFKKYVFDVSEPTSFYLMSDGFQDQFGGKENKKFMFSQMKKIFEQIHVMPCEDQYKYLNSVIREWMAPDGQSVSQQIDDILVFGAKVS